MGVTVPSGDLGLSRDGGAVGAAVPEDSLPALIAASLGAGTVENYAEDAATVDMLVRQGEQAKRTRYDYVFIQIGATDIVHFRDKSDAARVLAAALDALPQAPNTYLVIAGDLGKTRHFPFLVRPLFSTGSAGYSEEFERLAAARSITFVDLRVDPLLDPFVQEPREYFARDGLHPSSKGYAEWYDRFRVAVGL